MRRSVLFCAAVAASLLPLAAGPSPAGAKAAPGRGELRVTTSPAVASVVSVDGVERNVWGVAWVDIDPGSHQVCFSDVAGYATPACRNVTVPVNGVGTTVGEFTPLAALQVTTSPAVAGTISVRDVTAGGPAVPRDDWGVFSWVPAGHALEVCFGPAAGYAAPPCQQVPADDVVAGGLVSLTSTYVPDAAGTGPAGAGMLRVTTSPAVPSTISVDGLARDDWGLDWLHLAPGSHEVCFSDVTGYRTPACQTVEVTADETTTVVGAFAAQGWLRASSDPALEVTVTLDGEDRDDWGVWMPVDPGDHEVCFVPDSGDPRCHDVTVVAGEEAEVLDLPSVGGPVAEIDAGWFHSCARYTSGRLACWGSNSGQFGNGTYVSSTVAVPVSNITTATALTVSSSHTCAVLADGTLRCWGYNFSGGLGDGTDINRALPVEVSGISTATSVSAGFHYTCASLADGTVRCWGGGDYGNLGNGSTDDAWVPTEVSGITNAVAVSASSGGHACAALLDGTVRCWGENAQGQLGDGTRDNRSLPVTVPGLTGVVQVAAGEDHTCALLDDETVRCWGYNLRGQLGDGSAAGPSSRSLVPVQVSGLTDAVEISADNHSCARLVDGTARCWGHNASGQLGDGSTTQALVPVTVSGLTASVSLSARGNSSCAVLARGTARCWGQNFYGQLGDASSGTNRLTPVGVVGL